jgi:hypothetical protein
LIIIFEIIKGRLPAAAGPFADGSKDAATHLRKVFYRMGFIINYFIYIDN